jgi:predicted phosphoribosyltransferase
VAHEVATRLNLPLDVFLVRKLGVPGHSELAMGAIAAGGIEVLSHDLIRDLGIPYTLSQAINSAGTGSIRGVSEAEKLYHMGLVIRDADGRLQPAARPPRCA